MKQFIIIILFLFVVMKNTYLYANINTKQPAFNKISDEGQVILESDEMTFLKTEQKIILNGKVIITKPDIKMFADNIIIFYKNDEQTDKMQINTINAKKNVKIINGEIILTSEEAVYLLNKNEVTLLKNVKIIDKDNIIYGDKIIFDTITQNINIISGEKKNNKKPQRVKIIINDIKKTQDKYER